MKITDDFNGDTPRLIECIKALIELNDAGALVPHGIGGHARNLLSAAAARLSSAPPTDAAQGDDASESPWKYVTIRKLDADNWLVEITGMASAVSSVMSHDPREMLLASLAELIAEHGPPTAISQAQPQAVPGE